MSKSKAPQKHLCVNLQGLRQHADDPSFQQQWKEVKRTAKERAVQRIQELTGTALRQDALMDVQVKRIHEYKRQLLNVLGIIYRYDRIRNMSPQERKQASPPKTACCIC